MRLSSHARLYQVCTYISVLGILLFLLFPAAKSSTADSESQSSTELSSATDETKNGATTGETKDGVATGETKDGVATGETKDGVATGETKDGATTSASEMTQSTTAKSEKPKKVRSKGGSNSSTTKNPFGFKKKPKGGLDAKVSEENKRRYEKFKEAEANKSASDSEGQSSTLPTVVETSPANRQNKSGKPKKVRQKGESNSSTTKNPFGFKKKAKGELDAKMSEENKRRYEKFKEAGANKSASDSEGQSSTEEITPSTTVKSEKLPEALPTERSTSESPSSTAGSQRKDELTAKRKEDKNRRNKGQNQAGRSLESDEMRQWSDTKKQDTNENKQSVESAPKSVTNQDANENKPSLESAPKSDSNQDANEDKQSVESSPKHEEQEAPPPVVKSIKPVPSHPGQGEDNANEPSKPPSESDDEDSSKRHRNFPTCKCKQKFRANYITTDDCGKAALCYWEIWNYNNKKNIAANLTNDSRIKKKTRCDLYYIQKYTCLIGYPKPRLSNDACKIGEGVCAKKLATLLYNECAPLRKFYGYPKPEDIEHKIDAENLNYDLAQDESTMFRPQPNSRHPKWNNYYTISCPMIYRHPYFTISLLLKDLDPNIEYSEASGLVGVAEMLPHYVRDAMNSERMLNFDALSIDESYIHWCGIPRNYVCVRQEMDPESKMCDPHRLYVLRRRCGDGDQDPRPDRVRTPMAGAFMVSRNRTKGGRTPKPKGDGGKNE